MHFQSTSSFSEIRRIIGGAGANLKRVSTGVLANKPTFKELKFGNKPIC